MLNDIKLPPVSKAFYNKLVNTFPPIEGLDIKPATCIIELNRKAAQQEVISFISKAVRTNTDDTEPSTLWSRFKYVLLNNRRFI